MAQTPSTDKRTILKKSVLTFSSVPEKNIAGINAKIYPNPNWDKYDTPPPNAKIGKNIPKIIYKQIAKIPNLRPKRATIKKITGICGIYLYVLVKCSAISLLVSPWAVYDIQSNGKYKWVIVICVNVAIIRIKTLRATKMSVPSVILIGSPLYLKLFNCFEILFVIVFLLIYLVSLYFLRI